MAIIKDCELWFCKLDPKRPNNRFNKEKPTWECQIRTTDSEVRKKWEEMHLSVKPMIPDNGPPYWRVNLRKKSIKRDGDAASPVRVIDGNMNDVDPNTIGNGSIGHVRLYQYPYKKADGTEAITSVLMGIQLKRHKLYKMKPRGDEFEMEETEIIDEEPEGDEEVPDEVPATPKVPKIPGKVF